MAAAMDINDGGGISLTWGEEEPLLTYEWRRQLPRTCPHPRPRTRRRRRRRWLGMDAQICCLLVVFSLLFRAVDAVSINSTGASFPANVYSEATFAYQFTQNVDLVTYRGLGSGVGKCNIMGYWNTGNTESVGVSDARKQLDTLICTDACSVTNACGGSNAVPRRGATSVLPLVDFGASDSVLGAADYASFPDLQMLPALAGAAVIVYNVPDLSPNNTVILSRSTIAAIYMGKIRYWNHSSIIRDNVNNPPVARILQTVNKQIKVVIRTDSSGTSEIFSTALSLFDPTGGSSFAVNTGRGSMPKWCGQVTDEVHVMNITGCAAVVGGGSKQITMSIVDGTNVVRAVSFACDATASAMMAAFSTASYGHSLNVTVSWSGAGGAYYMGYSDAAAAGKNWYKPVVTAVPAGVKVVLTALQEGGYLNSHYNASYMVTPLIQSVWVIPTGSSMPFTVSFTAGTATYTTASVDANAASDLSGLLMSAINAVYSGAVASVSRAQKGSPWYEYKITFTAAAGAAGLSNFVATVSPGLPGLAGNVVMFAFQNYNNYPVFYDSAHPIGSPGSGRYTCYVKYLSYLPWAYYTGATNPGVIADVFTMPYSVGYSVLSDAMNSYLKMANMINLAGAVVSPSAYTVSSAVMDKGGNLDARFTATLADSSSVNAWPMSGLTYFIIRQNHHLGSCARRIQAMTYLYKYYYSQTVNQIALRLGFATLPGFIRDIVVSKLINSAFCSNGQLALAQYKTYPTALLTSNSFTYTVNSYISVYGALTQIDATTAYSVSSKEDSSMIWGQFDANPTNFGAAFTLLPSGREKMATYTDPDMLTFAFATVSAVGIYHLDAFTAKANAPLRVTPQILAGIFTGTIKMWSDPLLVAANAANGKFLPNTTITVVARSGSTDANAVFLRFLALNSPTFASQYAATMDPLLNPHYRTYNFPALQAAGRLVLVTQNLFVDNQVIAQDGTFGYYLHTTTPSSLVAWYCADTDRTCASPINPVDNGQSIATCMQDASTVVNPSKRIYSYDLMTSKAPGCYPIVGTVDLSLYARQDASTCNAVDASGASVVHRKIQWSAFMFNGSAIVNPLTTISAAPGTVAQRTMAYYTVCNLMCGSTIFGYQFCDYRDCGWSTGDFVQAISPCNPATQKRTVTYSLVGNTTCYQNPATMPPASILIDCDYVYAGSSVSSGVIAMAVIGIVSCAFIFYLTQKYSHEKVLRRSQLIFVYIFLVGAMLMNLTVLSMYGPNSNSNCMLRVWSFNLSSTIMYAPLIMKLHRVEVFYRQVQRGQRRKNISDTYVLMQVCGVLCVDFILCLVRSIINRPRQLLVQTAYAGVYATVQDQQCSTSIREPMEIAQVVWKALLLGFGVGKAIQTWDVPEDVSEAKYFAVAIYNIAVVGSFTYFLSVFGNQTVEATVVLRSLGIFISATISAIVIMVPKLLVIQLNWTELFLGTKSSYDEDEYSETPDTTGPTNQAMMGTSAQARSGVNLNGMGFTNSGRIAAGGLIQLAHPASHHSERSSPQLIDAIPGGASVPPLAIGVAPGGLPRLQLSMGMGDTGTPPRQHLAPGGLPRLDPNDVAQELQQVEFRNRTSGMFGVHEK